MVGGLCNERAGLLWFALGDGRPRFLIVITVTESEMEVVQRFTRRVTTTSLVLAIGLGVIAAPFNLALAKGLWLGGISACALFLLWAQMASRVQSGKWRVSFAMMGLSILRFVIYALVLWKAHSLDPERWMGFIGAVAGLSGVYVVIAAVGYTGRDLQEAPK